MTKQELYLSEKEKDVINKYEVLNRINNCKSKIENLNTWITDLQEQVEKVRKEINK